MFSGIIAGLGRIVSTVPLGDGLRLTIDAGTLDVSGTSIGDSIAVDGVCLTVVAIDLPRFDVEVSKETLDCTTGFRLGDSVNLERALKIDSRLDGHIVTGHVDGVGTIVEFESIAESWRLVVESPTELARYIAAKGSVAVNGVSLTTNRVEGHRFEINLIPHTVAVTTFGRLKTGDRVNIEIDLFARYIERMLSLDPSLGNRA